ncbi:hypothetical protein SAY87_024921 [Trapa incisa]|uniref:Uncharacterized protein n=1 Tax=Trapa incisa TaxID=236973 RepID=A0AAN7GKM7_9MYRT|nr:hypothetical protein SAY87_024921 [Trapa incisa]
MCSDQSSSSLDKSNDMANYGVILDIDPTKEKLSLRTLWTIPLSYEIGTNNETISH